MTEKQLQEIKIHLEGVIQEKVNGKIDRLMERIDPILEAQDTVTNISKFFMWFSKVVLSIGIVVGAIIAGIRYLK